MSRSETPTVVLVHGGFVDGSGWQGVYEHLKKDGHKRQRRPESDALARRRRRRDQAGHRRGGRAGHPRRPFLWRGRDHRGGHASQGRGARLHRGLRAGRGRVGQHPHRGLRRPARPQPPILAPQDGFLFLDREKFHASFAGDLSAEQAAFMADSQVPWGLDALGGTVSEAAWRSKPSWYLVTTEDRMIPPPAQRAMSERGRVRP